MEFKINNVTEIGDKIRIEYETAYGKHVQVFPIEAKALHIISKKPRWLHMLRERIDEKFKDLEQKSFSDTDIDQYIGQTMDHIDIEDLSITALAEEAQIKKMKLDKEKLRDQIVNEQITKTLYEERLAKRKQAIDLKNKEMKQ